MKEYRNIQICIDGDTNKDFESWSKRGWTITNVSNPLPYTDSKAMYYLVLFERDLKTKNKNISEIDSTKYFTEEEVQDFKDSSIKYPLIIFDKHQHNVTEVSQITGISGMPDNNGVPKSIAVQVHRKNEPVKYLTYKLQE